MPSEYQKHKLVYFRPGQIACHVGHPDPEPREDQLKAMVSSINEYLQGGHVIWPPRTLSFPAIPVKDDQSSKEPTTQPASPFSIIFCDLENVGDDPGHLLELISTLDTQLKARDFAGLILQAISPNWLASGAPGYGGSGGPGSWPVPFRGIPNRAPYDFPELRSQIAGMSGDGEGVDVAILDTAPCLHDLVEAFDEWQDRHPLIRSLLKPGGPLRLYPATHDALHRMASVQLNQHGYKMTDHGLFVAGIIHTIAPRATIHLIEVLNPYGVGDLESIAEGLLRVVWEIHKPERPLVVNCSLVLNLPLVPKHCHAEPDSNSDVEFEQAILRMIQDDPNPAKSKRQALALMEVCDLLFAWGRQVIAAAGNDWRDKGARIDAPQARYPAAFDSSVGVGALPKGAEPDPKSGKYNTSDYSNLADKPPMTGITTLGGESGEGQGVLGLYLGEFPSCEANCTKWAWWAGTSFATPILTGAVAAVLSRPPLRPPKTTQQAISELYTVIRSDKTPAGEDVLLTTQDYLTI